MEERTSTRRAKLLSKDQLLLCDWYVDKLGEVVTLSEAAYMWDKAPNAVKFAALTRKLDARKSFTGGDWLITVSSLIARYGKPTEDVLSWLKSK